MFAACQRALRSRHAAGQTKEKFLHRFQDSICVKACTFVGLRCTVRLPTLLIVALYGFFLSVRCLNNLRHHGWLLSSVICFFYFHFISFLYFLRSTLSCFMVGAGHLLQVRSRSSRPKSWGCGWEIVWLCMLHEESLLGRQDRSILKIWPGFQKSFNLACIGTQHVWMLQFYRRATTAPANFEERIAPMLRESAAVRNMAQKLGKQHV